MPSYRICIVNHDFSASEDIDAPDAAAARRQALRGALNIGTDEVCDGKTFFGAEISIEADDANPERLMIAIGTSRLR